MDRNAWFWRWRPSPLRRRSYLVEGWVLLAVGLATAVAAVVSGLVVARDVHHRLAAEGAGHHSVTAIVAQAAHLPGYPSEPRALVRWTAADGSTHSGYAKVALDARPGDLVTVWTDSHNALAARPPSDTASWLEAGIGGGAAATGVALAGLTVTLLVTQVTDRRRAELWAAEWAVIGPRWDTKKT
jgi:hypothetical protein